MLLWHHHTHSLSSFRKIEQPYGDTAGTQYYFKITWFRTASLLVCVSLSLSLSFSFFICFLSFYFIWFFFSPAKYHFDFIVIYRMKWAKLYSNFAYFFFAEFSKMFELRSARGVHSKIYLIWNLLKIYRVVD